jgi:hypothetical protein
MNIPNISYSLRKYILTKHLLPLFKNRITIKKTFELFIPSKEKMKKKVGNLKKLFQFVF